MRNYKTYGRYGRRRFNLDKTFVAFIIIVALILGKSVINLICTKTGISTNYTAEETLAILENASKIEVCKNYRTIFYNDYNIIVDGECVAVVTGEFFKLFGDTFTMYSSNGERIMYEEEEVFHLNRQAQFYSASGDRAGRLESKYFTILDKDTFYTQQGTAIARCDKQFAIPAKYIIQANGNTLYTIKKNFFFYNYTIYVEDNTVLNVKDAVMISCIEAAVASSSNSSSSSSSDD